MQELFTVSQASSLTGVSRPTIRAYTKRSEYRRYLSTESTPEHGSERLFTESDLETLKFIYTYTASGQTHAQALQALENGALDNFSWDIPEPFSEPTQGFESDTEALIPISQLRAAHELVTDAKEREAAAIVDAKAANARIAELERELGEAQGKLDGYRERQYRAPAWWRNIFGGEGG